MPGIDAQTTPRLVTRLRETCHDMRQPVASIFALAAAALADPALPHAARARLEEIVGQAEWLSDLIQHSLHPAGHDELGARRADLRRIANEAAAAERLTWAGELGIVNSREPVFTDVHPVLLRRMVANLLSNAMRAAGPSGKVIIRVGRDRDSALLSVEDTGPGFGKIEKGLGLGLAAVSRNAARHGGSLQYRAGANGGAHASLWLPLAGGQALVGGAEGESGGQDGATPRARPAGSPAMGGPGPG